MRPTRAPRSLSARTARMKSRAAWSDTIVPLRCRNDGSSVARIANDAPHRTCEARGPHQPIANLRKHRPGASNAPLVCNRELERTGQAHSECREYVRRLPEGGGLRVVAHRREAVAR